MSLENRLVIVSGIRYDLGERSRREARIDALAPDRSGLGIVPIRPWCPEAEAREPRLAAIRANVTIAERMDTWRKLFARRNRS